MTSATPSRSSRVAWPAPPPAPAIPWRTDPAFPGGRRAARPACGARYRRHHETSGRPASRPARCHRSVFRLLELLQDPIDALRVLDPTVETKMQLGTRPQMELARKLGAEIPGGTLQTLEGLRLLLFRPHHAHAHVRVRQIRRYVDTDHRHESDARIADVGGQKRAHGLPDQLAQALGAVARAFHQR